MIWSAFGRKLVALPGLSSIYSLLVAGGYIREKLTAARTYYVRTDGSDSNDGLANNSGGAFLTIAKAISTVAALDLSIYDVTIQIQDATWSGSLTHVTAPWVGSGTVTLQGNTATPANCVLSGIQPVRVQNFGSKLTITGFTIVSTSVGLQAIDGGTLTLGASMVFGACTSAHMRTNGPGSAIIATSISYTITGGSARHVWASPGGFYNLFNTTVTITGAAMAISTFAVADRLGLINANSMTFAGDFATTTGSRYSAASNAVINTSGGGANYFPGNAAGATATGGQYV